MGEAVGEVDVRSRSGDCPVLVVKSSKLRGEGWSEKADSHHLKVFLTNVPVTRRDAKHKRNKEEGTPQLIEIWAS